MLASSFFTRLQLPKNLRDACSIPVSFVFAVTEKSLLFWRCKLFWEIVRLKGFNSLYRSPLFTTFWCFILNMQNPFWKTLLFLGECTAPPLSNLSFSKILDAIASRKVLFESRTCLFPFHILSIQLQSVVIRTHITIFNLGIHQGVNTECLKRQPRTASFLFYAKLSLWILVSDLIEICNRVTFLL